MRIIYLPLENIEQRYSKMMNAELGSISDLIIYPEFNYSEKIEKGQFLDINKTCIFKSKQIQVISEMFYKGEIYDGDCFLVADIFFPGIESIRYMAELQKINVLMFGFNYAGRADKTDFVQGLGNWSDNSEKGYHECFNKVFVGSENHRLNVIDYFYKKEISKGLRKIINTGYIWNNNYCLDLWEPKFEKEDLVVWPHRICKEKGYEELLRFSEITDKKIVITSSGDFPKFIPRIDNAQYLDNLTKKQYYQILDKAKWYLSTAHQETFGYTLQEAMFYSCKIAVPNRACYPEMVLPSNLYSDTKDIDSVLDNCNLLPLEMVNKYNGNSEKIFQIILEEYNILNNIPF